MRREYHFEKSRNTLANKLTTAACVVAAVALEALAYQEFRAGELLPALAFSLGAIACLTTAIAPKR